jgi:outer membrane autotransporter protein
VLKKEKHDRLMVKLGELDKKPFVFGIKAGYNMATAQFDSKYKGKTGSVGGFHLGVTADMRLTDIIHFCSGLIYSAKGYTYDNSANDIDEEGKGQFIDIPLQASLRLPIGQTVKLAVNVGPYVAICAGGKVKDNWGKLEESFSTAYSGFDYGLQAGLGVIFSHHVQIGAEYQFGMGGSYRNRNLMVGVGYRF